MPRAVGQDAVSIPNALEVLFAEKIEVILTPLAK
jgi:hypothetical protein